MKKQRLPIFVYGILFLYLVISCSVEEDVIVVQSKTQLIENTKKWFYNSKEPQSLTILKHTKVILWENAIVSKGDNGEIVEVPIILQDNKTTSIGTKNEFKDYHRLLFAKDKNGAFKYYDIQIFTNETNFDNLNESFNFYNVSKDFRGIITIFDVKEQTVSLLNFKSSKKTKPKVNYRDSEPAVDTCVYIGWWYEDGSFEPITQLYCISGGGGSATVGSGTGTYGGGGSSTPAPTPVPVPTPCSIGEKTTIISKDSKFISASNSIMAASVDDNEHSITLGRDPKGLITLAPMNNGGPNEVETNTSWPGAFADIHNHTTNGPPASNDIVYAAVKKNEANSQHATSFVNVPSGNYAIVVANLAEAQAFVKAYPADISPIYPPEFPFFIFDQIDIIQAYHTGSSVEGRMSAVSYILDKYAAGITILKQDSDGNFKPLKMEETLNPDGTKTYVLIPCK